MKMVVSEAIWKLYIYMCMGEVFVSLHEFGIDVCCDSHAMAVHNYICSNDHTGVASCGTSTTWNTMHLPLLYKTWW